MDGSPFVLDYDAEDISLNKLKSCNEARKCRSEFLMTLRCTRGSTVFLRASKHKFAVGVEDAHEALDIFHSAGLVGVLDESLNHLPLHHDPSPSLAAV
jgi:hypothetical protein